MFELNGQKRRWRDMLLRTGIPHESLIELETHLDEAMWELSKKGLSEEEAFLIASHRIGPVDLLGGEYRKVGSGASRRTLEKGMMAFIAFCVIWTGVGMIFYSPLIVQVIPFTILPLLVGLIRFVRDESRDVCRSLRTKNWKRILVRLLFGFVALIIVGTTPVIFILATHEFFNRMWTFQTVMIAFVLLPIPIIGLLRILGDFFDMIRSANSSESDMQPE